MTDYYICMCMYTVEGERYSVCMCITCGCDRVPTQLYKLFRTHAVMIDANVIGVYIWPRWILGLKRSGPIERWWNFSGTDGRWRLIGFLVAQPIRAYMLRCIVLLKSNLPLFFLTSCHIISALRERRFTFLCIILILPKNIRISHMF